MRSIRVVTSAARPGWHFGRFLLQALMRPVAVIVPGVLSYDLAEMPLAQDQHVIQALHGCLLVTSNRSLLHRPCPLGGVRLQGGSFLPRPPGGDASGAALSKHAAV